MISQGRILVADDDETFLMSTADLLRRRRYQCDCAPDADTAMQLLDRQRYDLLIADIRMPGNQDLEFVGRLGQAARGMPVLLVTGYPSVRTASQSLQLPVAGYLLKPVDFDELLGQVADALRQSQMRRMLHDSRQRVEQWCDELTRAEHAFDNARWAAHELPVEAFLEMTLRGIVNSLLDLKHLTEAATGSRETAGSACHLLDCPRSDNLVGVLRETIAVLEKTKSAFKSKDLKDLRTRLQDVVGQA